MIADLPQDNGVASAAPEDAKSKGIASGSAEGHARQLAQELAVHQAELEQQNEELRATQAKLQEARDRYAALYEYAPVGYVALDHSGIIRQTNATWRNMVNRPEEDFRGRPFTDALYAEDAPVFLGRFRSFFRNPAEKQIVVRMNRVGAAPFYAQLEAQPHLMSPPHAANRNEAYTELLVIISDISALQETRVALEQANRNLQQANVRKDHINAILGAIRNVNQLITHENDPQSLIGRACVNLTENMGYFNAWAVLLDSDGAIVGQAAKAGRGGGYSPEEQHLAKGAYPPCLMRALQHADTVVIEDPAVECAACPIARACGDFSSLARQFCYRDKCYGALVVAVPREYAHEPEELSLFDEVADDLAFALYKIETESQFKETQRRYRDIFEGSRDGFVVVDAAGRFLDANEAYCAMLGYTLKELLALPDFYSITPPRWRDWERREIAKQHLLALEYSSTFEKEYIRKDGVCIPVEMNVHIVRNGVGDVAYIWALVRNLTEKKQHEARITLLGQMLDDAPASITIHDIEGRFLFANRQTVQLHGYDNEEQFRAINLHDLDAPESETKLAERLQRIREQGQARFEVAHYRKDGTTFPLEVLARKIDWHGQPAILSVAADITDRKQTEQVLAESEERFRILIESAPMSILLMQDGVYQYGNPASLRLLGYDSMQDIVGVPALATIPPEFHGIIMERMKRVQAGLDNPPIEIQLLKATGDRVWTYTTSVPITLGGKPAAIIVGQDITERKQAEAALRESEAKHRSLVEGLPDIILRFDREIRCLFVSPNVASYSDQPAAEILGRTPRELGFSDELSQKWETSAERLFTTGAAHETEFSFAGHGKQFTFNWRMSPEYDADGQVQSILAIGRDVTAHREMERNYQMLFREMLNGFALHEIICNDQGEAVDYRFLAVNPAFERLTGLRGEEIVGRTVLEIMPDTERHWIEAYGRVALTGEPAHFKNLSGALDKYFEVAAFRPAPGQFACIFTDITESKRLEEQLRQAQKMEAVGQLAGGVAHDFNNILQVILVQSEFVQEDHPIGTPTRTAMDEIRGAAQRAADLTRQLLAFSRRQVIQPVHINLNDLIQDVLKMVRRVIGEHIQLAYLPARHVNMVMADKGQMEQVLMNLCVNARDAMPQGGRLTIETGNVALDDDFCRVHPWAAPGQYVFVSVADTGMGMDESIRTHIFEPFFTTKDVGKGTGLGLATVYGVVKQHNGMIHVYSEPGAGTAFKIYLPAVKGTGAKTDPVAVDPAVGGQETILVAEDEPAVLRLVAAILASAGYTVLTAADGVEALRMYEANAESIDLALLDVMMPNLGGRQVMDRILAAGGAPRFLFSSGYSEAAIHKDFVIEEGLCLIQKPYHKQDLLRAVRETLDAPV